MAIPAEDNMFSFWGVVISSHCITRKLQTTCAYIGYELPHRYTREHLYPFIHIYGWGDMKIHII